MKRYFLIVLLFSMGTFTWGQSRWDLKSCIEFGLKSNPSTNIYENQKKIADAQAKQALGDYLPSIIGTGSVDDNLRVQEQVIPAGLFGDEDIRVAFTKQFTANGTLQLSQTFYDQSLLTGLKANKFNKEKAKLNQRKNDESIIYNISVAFYQIYIYQQQLDLLKINLDSYRQQLDIVGLKVKKGTALQKDYDKVLVDFNNTQSQIRVAETNINLSKNQLKYEMGFPFQDNFEIDYQELKKEELSVAYAISDFNINQLTDHQLDQNNLNLLAIDEKRIKNQGLPTLSGYARYGWNGFGDQLGEAFSNLKAFSAIGVKLSIPVFDGFRRKNQVAEAHLKYQNAEETNRLNQGKYALEYQNSTAKLEKSRATLETYMRNIKLAQSVFDVTDLQYQKGVTDMTDWLNSQNSLRTSQNNYLSSSYEFLQAKIDVEKAKGTLLQFYQSL